MHSQGSLWLRGFGGLALALAAVIWAFAAATASGQGPEDEQVSQGEGTFGQVCAACHTIGGGVRVGPDLKNVTERREESWLKTHILSPSVHHQQNDPVSVANRERYGIKMPDLGLTEQQVEAVIAFLRTDVTASTAIPPLYGPTLAAGVLAIVGLTLLGLRVGTKRVEVRP
ncbi:MAG: cytochrome c [Dehalococcoidia bacterium]